eukprot:Skav203400  [mRNA]  locus=scaffold1743:49736:55430:- [translate_table: standard]
MGALMHLAGVLADGVLPSLRLESLERSYAPKAGEAVQILGHCQQGTILQAQHVLLPAVLQDPAGALWRNARSVQWGPWAEVGMAVQANTLGRAKSMGSLVAEADVTAISGVGAVTNSQGLAIMNSTSAADTNVDFEAEAKKEAPASRDAAEARAARGEASGGGSLSALAGLSPEERLEAGRGQGHRDTQQEMARQSERACGTWHVRPDGFARAAEAVQVASGVEFRNRLQTEFDGVNLPNSMVFDYPTVTATWRRQLGSSAWSRAGGLHQQSAGTSVGGVNMLGIFMPADAPELDSTDSIPHAVASTPRPEFYCPNEDANRQPVFIIHGGYRVFGARIEHSKPVPIIVHYRPQEFIVGNLLYLPAIAIRLGDLPAEPASASTAVDKPAAPAAETYVESLNAHCVTKGAGTHGADGRILLGATFSL